jgi:hypothetical protein
VFLIANKKVALRSIHFARTQGKVMRIYLFRDESDSGAFAFSTNMTGSNIPPVTPHTEWIFLEAIDTLTFPEPWDIDDFQPVIDHLKEDGYYLFEGELIGQPSLKKGRRSTLEC